MSATRTLFDIVEPHTMRELHTLACDAGVGGVPFKVAVQKRQTDLEYRRGDFALTIEWELRAISQTYDQQPHIVAQDVSTGRIVRIDIDTDANLMTISLVDT